MNTPERIVVYGALALLLGLNLSDGGGGGGPSAVAGAGPSEEKLGPARSLTLTDEDRLLVLRNRAGRLAWADNDHARTLSIGFVHVGKAVGPLLDSEQYADERQRLEDEIKAIDEALTARIEAFREEHREVEPGDPEAEEVARQHQMLMQEFEQWRMERAQRLGKLAAEQIEDAYRDLVAAVEVVAERREIDLVFRFIPTDNDFLSLNPTQAYTAVRARIALKYPDGLDITDQILEELALEVE
ncbi:MAG: OmpH family outer membrane protein [Planctomycetota bacterium]|jgi:Skp family chaperone for outer membrane proteins